MVSWNNELLDWPTEAELDAELHAALDDECGCVLPEQSCPRCTPQTDDWPLEF